MRVTAVNDGATKTGRATWRSAVRWSPVAVVALGAVAACASVGLGGKADRDHDGIADDVDLCPDQAETVNGFEDWDGCPDEAEARAIAHARADDDHDGIPNDKDLCPTDPEDRDGFEDNDGCPDPDNDKDRIADVVDKCPNEPETYNGFEDEDGCPDRRGGPLPVPLKDPPGGEQSSVEAVPASISSRFQRHLGAVRDVDFAGLRGRLRLSSGARGPSFDVHDAKYFALVAETLQMTPAELRLLETTGLAGVDHGQRNSMASIYQAIWARDLPVLITSDSMLHALHRSFDKILQEVEVGLFSPTMARILEGVEAKLAGTLAGARDPAVREGLADVDLYVTVARNLLAGGGALPDEKDAAPPFAPVASATGVDAEVRLMLDKIRSLKLETPNDASLTVLRGGTRLVDYSQFRPRGHYARSARLRRYFRTMMWLGRVDLGFALEPSSGLRSDRSRELRAVATLDLLLRQSDGGAALEAVANVVDFLVGASDDVTVPDVDVALRRAGVGALDDLASESKLARLGHELGHLTPQRGQIVGNVEISNPGQGPTAPPKVVQLFGQRFTIDSFVLSKVVFDSVPLHGEPRTMPSGLDVMGALGDDEAVSLLAPDVDRFGYAPQLAAARLTVGDLSRADWDASLYGMWLDALRTLHAAPAPGALFPSAMRTEAWRRKQLQTQLASWTELRHDTILYVKQSVSIFLGCSYPAAYVEPYPTFFARLAALTRATARRLRGIDLSKLGAQRTPSADGLAPPAADLIGVRDGQAAFLDAFGTRMEALERLARKELAGKPFTNAETDDLRKMITKHRRSGGQVWYDGWYPGLIYGGQSEKWSPTIADVHLDPNEGRVLEAGTGDVTFLVVAVDNKADRAVYVGPAYTYYELEASADHRMTDAEWETTLSRGQPPPRPKWTSAFQAPAVSRSLDVGKQ